MENKDFYYNFFDFTSSISAENRKNKAKIKKAIKAEKHEI